jgi:hypothetical protein
MLENEELEPLFALPLAPPAPTIIVYEVPGVTVIDDSADAPPPLVPTDVL